jgi:hypothetical protein
MWKGNATIITQKATIDQLWNTLTDIQNWNTWDHDIAWTSIEGPVKQGAEFYLKPKDGPKTKLHISEYTAPNVFSDVAYLPLAKMRTTHRFTQTEMGIEINIEVEVSGFLSFLWSRIIAQNQIKGAEQQTQNLIDKACMQ